MNITRRALLISNPGEPGAENYCKGVFVDIENYKTFFGQPQGGWWKDSEIVHLHRPSKADARAAVDSLRYYDYSYVAFSGHGWYSSVENATILTLRKGEELPYHELLKDTTKRTLVLDCCRKVYHEPVSEAMILKNSMAARMLPRTPNPQLCRDEFLRQIQQTSNAAVVIHSCRTGETAGDDDTRGGRYTGSLLFTAEAWAKEQSQSYATGAASLSIVASHEPAAAATRQRSGGTQNPTIEKPRSERHYFPFAVFA